MDEDLVYINRFKSGDLGGFEMLVKKYYNRSLNIANSLVFNVANSQDIVQEAFIKVYNNLSSFRGDSKFFSWLYRVVVNCSYDFLRKNKDKMISLEDPDCPDIACEKDSPDLLAGDLIKAALSKVPFRYRSAVILRDIEGLSYEDIGKALGVGVGTVESRIFRGRQILKDILVKRGVLKNVL